MIGGKHTVTGHEQRGRGPTRFILEVELDNAAFEDNDPGELKRAIRAVADKITTSRKFDGGKVMDVNGNSVGYWSVE